MHDLAHVRTVLKTYRRLFEEHAGANLRAGMVHATTEELMRTTRPDTPNPLDPDDNPDVRGSFPLPIDLQGKTPLSRCELPCPDRPFVRDLVYFGDAEALNVYRKLARPALLATLGAKDILIGGVSTGPSADAIGDAAFIESCLGIYGPGDDATWTLAVIGLLDEADNGEGALLERWVWTRSEETAWGQVIPIADRFWSRSAGGSAEAPAIARHGVATAMPVNDLFTCAIIAIDTVVSILDRRITNSAIPQVDAGRESSEAKAQPSGDVEQRRDRDPSADRLRIDAVNGVILLDGNTYRVSEQQAAFVQAIVDAGPRGISFPKMLSKWPILEGANPSRIRTKLPGPVGDIIESDHAGHRLRPLSPSS